MSAVAEATTTAAVWWRLLSLGFSVPGEAGLEEVEALAEALREGGGPDELDALLAVLGSVSAEELGAQYQALFGGTVLVAPYEGSYESDPVRQGRELADVAAFYRAFGAEAHGPAHERPDHVGCELEFLAFLELKRLESREADTELAGEILSAFVRDHAGRWLPAFFEEVRGAAVSAPYYATLAVLGSRVVGAELERHGIDVTPVRQRRSRVAVERDSFDCA